VIVVACALWASGCSLLDPCGGTRDPYCDGNTLVECHSPEGGNSSVSHTPCSVACVATDHVAFCALSDQPYPGCDGASHACYENMPVSCEHGYLADRSPIACPAETPTCFPCKSTAICGLEVDPTCTPSTVTGCANGMQVFCDDDDFHCGVQLRERACPTGSTCMVLQGEGYSLHPAPTPTPDIHDYGTCVLAMGSRCQAGNEYGEYAYCEADVMTQCFLDFPVMQLTCKPGTCDPGGNVNGSCGDPSNVVTSIGSRYGI